MYRNALLFSATALLFFSSCSGDDPTPSEKKSQITKFTVSPESIQVGQQVTLTWETTGASGVNIEPRIGLQAASGTATDHPAVTTTYTISIPGGPADAKAQATVTVTGNNNTPRIVKFDANPTSIQAGGTVTLSWETENVTQVEIQPNVGVQQATGSITEQPTQTTTYTLTTQEGALTQQVTVQVGGSNPPTVSSFTATPLTINPGDTARLEWTTQNADEVAIEPGLGTQVANGFIDVSPAVTVTYRLIARKGLSSSQPSEVTVTVSGGPPRVNSFTATPQTISPGDSAQLTWTTSNADDVEIDQGIGVQSANGNVSVTPNVTTTYRLVARGGGQTSQPSEVTIVVASGNQPRVISFTATPQTIAPNDPVTLAWQTEYANVVTISGVAGQQPTTGQVSVNPQSTTTYTLTAVGDGGQANASVTVTVNPIGTPTVLFFTATPATIATGGSAQLDWDTTDADGVTIDNGIGNQPAKGNVTVSPAQTTTYTLTAYNAAHQVTQQVTVTVAGANQPVITRFDAQPSVITSGGTTTLTWTTQNTNTVDIDNSVGTGLGANDSIQVSPTQTTTYTLTANGTGGTATQQVTVTVVPPAPTVVSFTTSPASIVSGGSAVLSWTTNNAISVDIDNGVGTQPANGNATVSPTQTTLYTLTATGAGGTASAQVTVTVTQQNAPQIVSFTATPQQIAPGAQATLAWQVTDATDVTIDNGIGTQPLTGNVNVTPAATTTYTLTAVGTGGQTTSQVTVSVVSVVGDTCGDAFAITGSGGSFTGNTNTATNDYQDSGSCTNYTSRGPDVVYQVQLQSGDRIEAILTPTGWDAAIYVVTSCSDVSSSCVAGQDNGGTDERIDYTTATAGDFYIIVDGYGSTSGGDFTLDVTITPAPIVNDECSGAIDVSAGGTFSGDTTNATGNYNPGYGGCTGYTAAANDVTFQTPLAVGERLQASLDAAWDAAIYLVTDCADVTTNCVQGQDDGNPEEIDFTAQTAGTYFIIVDAWGSAAGNFDLTVTISPPVMGGETCQNPVTIPTGGGSFQSTTTGLNNDYAPAACASGFAQAGPDQVYGLTLASGDIVELNASFESGLDGSLYVVTDCADLDNSCVAGADDALAGADEQMRFVAQTAGAHFIMVDAFLSTASGQHDLTVAHYTTETCAEAAPLDTTDTAEWFTTNGLANDYSPNSGGCTGFTAAGPDRAYSVAVNPGDQLQVSVDPTSFDASLYIVENCADISGSCIEGSDTGVSATEQIQPIFQQSGTYYVIIDGFGTAQGDGTITARVARGDTCADAYSVPESGGEFRGTTAGYAADYGITSGTGSCTSYSQEGADAVYAIELDSNQTLTASVDTTWDSALYLITDCSSSATTCVAGQDNGNPEEITYTNTGATTTYYLIVDSWRESDSITREGSYTLTIGIQ